MEKLTKISVEYSDKPKFRLDAKQYYENVSSYYDGFYENIDSYPQYIKDSIKYDLKQIKKILSNTKTENIIDLGCGTSYWSNYYKPDKNLILIDSSTKMLNISKFKTNQSLINTFTYCSDIFKFNEYLTIDNATIFMGFILSHYDDKQIKNLIDQYINIVDIKQIIVIDSVYGKYRKQNHPNELYKNINFGSSIQFSVYKRYFDRMNWYNFITDLSIIEDKEKSYWGESFFISTLSF